MQIPLENVSICFKYYDYHTNDFSSSLRDGPYRLTLISLLYLNLRGCKKKYREYPEKFMTKKKIVHVDKLHFKYVTSRKAKML